MKQVAKELASQLAKQLASDRLRYFKLTRVYVRVPVPSRPVPNPKEQPLQSVIHSTVRTARAAA